MNQIKAVLFGCAFIVVVMLTMQLAYIFIAVGANMLAKSYPFINALDNYFRYLIGFPVLVFILLTGGYITAATARKNCLLLCFIVGVLTVGTMFISTTDKYSITLSGYLVFIAAVLSPVAGGWYWQRKHAAQAE